MNEPTEITTARKEMVLRGELEMWQNTKFQAKIKHNVGKDLDNQAMIQDAVKLATDAEIGIARVMSMFEELPKAEDK